MKTKQTPRKSTGGRAARKALASKAARRSLGIERRLERSQTPLHRAAIGGNVAILKALLKSGKAQIDKRDSNDFTALHYAAQEGHVEACEVLLSKGASITTITGRDKFSTPLGCAIKHGHEEVVRLLLTNNATLTTAPSSITSLHHAAKHGRLGIAKLLLSNGVSLKTWNSCNETAIDKAVAAKHWDVAKLLLEEGQKGHTNRPAIADQAIISVLKRTATCVHLPNPESHLQVASFLGLEDMILRLLKEQGTCASGAIPKYDLLESAAPLVYAVVGGRQGSVAILLASGADVNGRSTKYEMPIWYALRHNHHDIAATLFAAGAAVTDGPTSLVLSRQGSQTAARLISQIQSLEVLTMSLLEISLGKYVHIIREFFTDAAVSNAHKIYLGQEAFSSPTILVKRLLQSTYPLSTIDANAALRKATKAALKVSNHFVAVFLLASILCPGILHDLLDRHPNIKAKADEHLPHHLTSAHQHDRDIVACLSEAGYSEPVSQYLPRTSPEDLGTRTRLYQACEDGNTNQVRRLLHEGGCEIDACGIRNRTALHQAAQSGHLEMVKLLVQHGADLHAKTIFGSTADDLATKRGHQRVADFLKMAKEEEDAGDAVASPMGEIS